MQDDVVNARSAPRPGLRVPALTVRSTAGPLDLELFCADSAVLYVYPATGVPGRDPALDPAPGWDDISGAAGCTSQCLGFKHAFAEFDRRGIRVAGISSQPLAEQREFAARHAIPFPLICDELHALQQAWGLPVFHAGGRDFLRRLVLHIVANEIERVIYPVVAPAKSADATLESFGKNVPSVGRRAR